MNRRGNVMDILWFVGAFFVVVILAMVMTKAYHEFDQVIQNDSSISADVKTPMTDFRNRTPGALDSGIVFAFIAMHITIIFLGLMLRSHPLLFPILMVALLIITLLAGYMSQTFDEVASDAELSSFDDEYPMSSWLLDNYILVTLAFGFLDIIAFLAIGAFSGGASV